MSKKESVPNRQYTEEFKAHVTGAWPKLAGAPAADLTADDVLDMPRRLIEQGKGRMAIKLRSYLHAA